MAREKLVVPIAAHRMPVFFLHAADCFRILRSASSGKARILTLCVLLLSIAPLWSICFLLTSLGLLGAANDDDTGARIFISHGVPRPSDLSTGAATPLGLEELWKIVFIEQQTKDRAGSIVLTFTSLEQHHASTHLRIFLPWAISFLLGVVVPTTLSVWSFLCTRRIRADRAQRREERLWRALQQWRQSYSKQLTGDDRDADARPDAGSRFCDNDGGSVYHGSQSIHEEREVVSWRLPRPGCPNDEPSMVRTVDDACTICLHPYQLEESVGWSSNPACVHTYHERCIVEWLQRKKDSKLACPCCRQCFVSASPKGKMSFESTTTLSDSRIYDQLHH